MSIINQYGTITGGIRNVSGNTLPDIKGSANGTIEGVYNPVTINPNGYLTFNGTGDDVIARDWGRVRFNTRTTFDYATNSKFTYTIIFRSSKSDGNSHYLFVNADRSIQGFQTILVDSIEEVLTSFNTGAATYKLNYTGANNCDGKFHAITFTWESENNVLLYVDGKSYGYINSISAGNMFSESAKAILGAIYDSTVYSYKRSFNGNISFFSNSNPNLSAGNTVNIFNQLNCLI